MLTGKHYKQTTSRLCECACELAGCYAGCKCMNTPHTRMASRQCECACEPSYDHLGCTCTHTNHTQMAFRRCECTYDASERQLWCTCIRRCRKQKVARLCVSLHDCHSLISTCCDTSMLSSRTCARLPRVQCEEGREQTHPQRHLRGSIHKHIPLARL